MRLFRTRPGKLIFLPLLILIALYLVLLIPFPSSVTTKGAGDKPFVWDKDELWKSLEMQYKEAKGIGCEYLNPEIDSSISSINLLLDSISSRSLQPDAPQFGRLETQMFRLAPEMAVCFENLSDYVELVNRMRRVVKEQSRDWDMKSREARERIYRLLYGGRAAVEEVLLQAPPDRVPKVVRGSIETSRTPSGMLGDLRVHSGDILISRGGASVSALIARGNDYPGNFSHVALVYVDDSTHEVSVIESVIEKGVIISSPEEYIKDKKLRIMVLRPRFDLPALDEDPRLPHKVAKSIFESAGSGYIPYDFAMDYNDREELFCSEVVSTSYKEHGIDLWMGISSISSEGITSWLSALGVEHFETQEPSDLEYDPQLIVIAEWRDPETLYKDHLDNAVLDVMLEEAEKGKRLSYPFYMLPFSRVVKLYSMILNLFGKHGPIPDGMNSEAALKVSYFDEEFLRRRDALDKLCAEFEKTNGYKPPFWQMIELARSIPPENSY